MAATAPMMSFLRPMGLPRPATLRQFMRFSTSTPCLEAREKREGMSNMAPPICSLHSD
jgi:large subunit ribosomal protein L49